MSIKHLCKIPKNYTKAALFLFYSQTAYHHWPNVSCMPETTTTIGQMR